MASRRQRALEHVRSAGTTLSGLIDAAGRLTRACACRVDDPRVTASSGQAARHQGDVLISNPSPLTGERELYTVVSADIYNAAGRPTVLVAEIETGTRYRATAHATETDYGVVLADRLVWLPVDMLGEQCGRLADAQRDRVVDQIVAVVRGY